MKITKLAVLTAVTTFVFPACEKPDDIQPTFTIESPVNNGTYSVGSNIDFKAIFKDNKELSQYKIDIHDDIDVHGHNKTDSTVTWSEALTGDLAGKEQTATRDIAIPVDAKVGPYHFIVKCIDAAGNEASFQAIDIMVQ